MQSTAAPEMDVHMTVPLDGTNLVIAGDSNDQRFFVLFCRRLTGRFDPITYLGTFNLTDGPLNGSAFFPEQSRPAYCHDERRNCSVIFFFHYGLFSAPARDFRSDSCLLTLSLSRRVSPTNCCPFRRSIAAAGVVAGLCQATIRHSLPGFSEAQEDGVQHCFGALRLARSDPDTFAQQATAGAVAIILVGQCRGP